MSVRLVGLLCALIFLLAGCETAPEPTKKPGRTLVGKWTVTGENVPIVQTFTDDGRFTSESENELSLGDGAKVTATIIANGSYKYDGKKLYTTIGSIDVRGTSEAVKENLVHNSQENVGKSYSLVLEWKSNDEIVGKKQDGALLIYKRIE